MALISRSKSVSTDRTKITDQLNRDVLWQVSGDQEAVNLSTTDYVSNEPFGVFVGTGGNIALQSVGSSNVCVYKGIQDGFFIPGWFIKIVRADTTATDIIAFN